MAKKILTWLCDKCIKTLKKTKMHGDKSMGQQAVCNNCETRTTVHRVN